MEEVRPRQGRMGKASEDGQGPSGAVEPMNNNNNEETVPMRCSATVLMKIFHTESKIMFIVVWVWTHRQDYLLELHNDCPEIIGEKQCFAFALSKRPNWLMFCFVT